MPSGVYKGKQLHPTVKSIMIILTTICDHHKNVASSNQNGSSKSIEQRLLGSKIYLLSLVDDRLRLNPFIAVSITLTSEPMMKRENISSEERWKTSRLSHLLVIHNGHFIQH